MFSVDKVWKKAAEYCVIVLILAVFLALPVSVSGAEKVRVGFFEFEGYHREDSYRERSGYGYEYLQYLARYADFSYEYLGYDKSWSQMQDMLEHGEIDLLTSAQKTPERMERFDFSKEPIGTSYGILTVKAGNGTYMVEEYRQLDGIRVGMLKGNSRNDGFAAFAKSQGFSYEPVYFQDSEALSKALQEGEAIDGAVSSNLRKTENEWVVAIFSPSPFYVMVQKGNRELLEKIDEAIEQIEIYNPNLQEELLHKYYSADTGDEIPFTAEERQYIKELQDAGTVVKVLVNPDRHPYSYYKDGRVQGVIPKIAELLFENAGIPYEMLQVESRGEYRRRQQDEAVSVRMDSRYDLNEAEKDGYKLTEPYLEAIVSCVMRKEQVERPKTIAAIRNGDITEKYIEKEYTPENITYYDTTDECVEAVLEGRQEGTYAYIYTAQQLVVNETKNRLKESMVPEYTTDFAVAVRQNRGQLLYSILNKSVLGLDREKVERIVMEESAAPLRPFSLEGYLYDHPAAWFFLAGVVILAALVIIYSIYKRKKERLERKQVQEFERFITYVCRANDGVYEVDFENSQCLSYCVMDGKVVREEISWEKVAGFLEKVGPADREAVEKAAAKPRLPGLADSGEEIYFECRAGSKEQGYRWNSYSVQGMQRQDSRQGSLLVFVKNIDAVKREEERKRQALEDALGAALQAGEAKGAFMSRMSHEIRTPLNGIIGYLSLARASIGEDAKTRDLLEKSEYAAQHLLSIVNDVLDISAIESGKLKISKEPFRLRSLLEGVSSVFHVQAAQKGLDFRITIHGLTNEWLLGDQMRVNQILMNLLSNAVKFTPSGGMVTLTVTQKAVIGEQVHFLFEIADTGIGMSEEYKQRLFTPFEQQDDSTARRFGGTGLGLSIAKNLVTMMGGAIAVESKEGEGTVFVVGMSFEAVQEEQKAVTEPQREAGQAEGDAEKHDYRADLAGSRLLVAEDNEMNAEIVSELLREVGVSVTVVSNGEAAVKEWEQSEPGEYHAILMDIQMPVMDGYQAAEKIRSGTHPRAGIIPIIALTADAFKEDINRALGAGMNDHVAKPIDIEKLCLTLKKQLGKD